MKEKKAEKSAAIVTIKDAANMTKRGRRKIALWLRQQAEFLEEHGNEFDRTFRARYIYKDN